MAKPIEMNIKEDSGYDVLYPITTMDNVINLQSQLSQYLPLAGGTMSGNLILNTSSPTNDLQAVSKGYVDNSLSKAIEIIYNGSINSGSSTKFNVPGLANAKLVIGFVYSNNPKQYDYINATTSNGNNIEVLYNYNGEQYMKNFILISNGNSSSSMYEHNYGDSQFRTSRSTLNNGYFTGELTFSLLNHSYYLFMLKLK